MKLRATGTQINEHIESVQSTWIARGMVLINLIGIEITNKGGVVFPITRWVCHRASITEMCKQNWVSNPAMLYFIQAILLVPTYIDKWTQLQDLGEGCFNLLQSYMVIVVQWL